MSSSGSEGENFQIVMVGECGVGKSALTQQFLKGFFLQDYDPTVDDKYQKTCSVDGKESSLEIIDTAGQEAYQALRDNYLRTGEGFIVMYSVADRNSYEKTPQLFQHILKVKETESVPCVLVGNKSDLDPEDRVSENEGIMLAQKLKIPFFETSAKNRENVDEAYAALVRSLRSFPKQKIVKKVASSGAASKQRKQSAISKLFKKIGGK